MPYNPFEIMTFTPFRMKHFTTIIEAYMQQTLPLDLFLCHYFRSHRSLGSKDRALLTQTLYDYVKWRSLIDVLAQGQGWEARLEAYDKLKNKDFNIQDPSLPPHLAVSCPEELFDLLLRHYGLEGACALSRVSNSSAPIAIRANLLKTTPEDLLKELRENHTISASEHIATALIFDKRENFSSLIPFKEGLFEVQDESSQRAAACVAALPGEQVLDYCAGAGGKALAIAATMGNRGQLYLHDLRLGALKQAKMRLRRAGVQNAQFLSPEELTKKPLKSKLDWVLVDAPCSGTGTLRRNPDMKWAFSLEKLRHLQSLQREVFAQALPYLHPRGKIVYATCSILPEENQEQAAFFMQEHKLTLTCAPLVILPTHRGGDGFYAATFKRSSI